MRRSGYLKSALAAVIVLAFSDKQAPAGTNHWAFQPFKSVSVPDLKNKEWPKTPIDNFILFILEQKRLRPNGEADRRTLLRRVTFDLIGLPPAPQDIDAFLEDRSSQAFAKVVDRLLDSPHYGERWGRHWMDLVRYADTAGDNSDYPVPQLYLYRNYIIDAFNRDKPFDRFIREQIAGDLLSVRDQKQRNEQVIATGYIALSRRFGSVVDRYPQHQTIEDTLDNMGRTFLGLSLSCARCHDHKFDPISTRDYYGLYGIFDSTRYAFPGIELLKVQKDFVPLVSDAEFDAIMAPHREKERELQKRHDDLAAQRKQLEAEKLKLDGTINQSTDSEERKRLTDENQKLYSQIEEVRKKVRTASEALEAHRKKLPKVADAYAVRDDKPHDVCVQLKGDPGRQGELVPRKFPDVLGGQQLSPNQTNQSGRLQLAEWIIQSPLTARVIANRIWHYHFGSGLVRTPSDFGVRGLPPTHPELLDWLAQRFVAEGWSIKKLHRLILLSRTYQLSSADNQGAMAADPENTLHWRFNRRRLDAESLRDTMLLVSGQLDRSRLDAPHPFPPSENWDFTQHHPFKDVYVSNRRSVYLMTKRLTALPYLQTFDGPDPNANTCNRDCSVTTLQALYFMNSDFVHEQSKRLAHRLTSSAPDERKSLDLAFQLTLGRPPTSEERTKAEAHLSQVKAQSTGEDKTLMAWTSFARVLFRLNEFVYLD